MPEVALTIAFFFTLLRGSLQGRRTPRGRRIFRNRHGVLFRNRFRQPFFHPHRRSRRNGLAGRRGRGRVGGRHGHGGLRDARQTRLDLDWYRRMSAAIDRRRRRRQLAARLNTERFQQEHALHHILHGMPLPVAQRLPTPTPNGVRHAGHDFPACTNRHLRGGRNAHGGLHHRGRPVDDLILHGGCAHLNDLIQRLHRLSCP
ncbi:hypothetical protein EJB05_39638 [Eragrostis curvula]|uniref:Secreted protein n=1 Tax=Eragrostis curvula TaxID=38414 RepID=A0A5J9TXL5_9POAL|nr:hypothetical protein EJB05_39638 [Eragrostis curvula]